MSRKKTIIEVPELVTTGWLTDATGLTDQWLRNLAKQGYFPECKEAAYPFKEVIGGLIRYYKELAAKKESANVALAVKRGAVAEEDALRKKQKRLKEAGELVTRSAVEKVWGARKAAVRQVIEQMQSITKKERARILEELEALNVDEYLT